MVTVISPWFDAVYASVTAKVSNISSSVSTSNFHYNDITLQGNSCEQVGVRTRVKYYKAEVRKRKRTVSPKGYRIFDWRKACFRIHRSTLARIPGTACFQGHHRARQWHPERIDRDQLYTMSCTRRNKLSKDKYWPISVPTPPRERRSTLDYHFI